MASWLRLDPPDLARLAPGYSRPLLVTSMVVNPEGYYREKGSLIPRPLPPFQKGEGLVSDVT